MTRSSCGGKYKINKAAKWRTLLANLITNAYNSNLNELNILKCFHCKSLTCLNKYSGSYKHLSVLFYEGIPIKCYDDVSQRRKFVVYVETNKSENAYLSQHTVVLQENHGYVMPGARDWPTSQVWEYTIIGSVRMYNITILKERCQIFKLLINK